MKISTPIRPEDEEKTQIPIEYEDAQKAEEETLIELKGWHALRRGLEASQPEWWKELQTAWRDVQSEDANLNAAAQATGEKIDTIAEVLTKAQTDADVESGLRALVSDQ